jgi:hypothetical protein
VLRFNTPIFRRRFKRETHTARCRCAVSIPPLLPSVQAWGLGLGAAASVAVTTLRTPAAAAAAGGIRATLYEVVPLTTAAAVLYTLGSSVAQDIRGGIPDWRSDAVGGALAGAVVAGIRRKNLNAAFIGALVAAGGAASVKLFQSTEGHATIGRPRAVDTASMIAHPKDFGAAASASGGLTRRLS